MKQRKKKKLPKLPRPSAEDIHKFNEDACSVCGTSFIGEEIPEASRHWYGGHTHFSRSIGIYDMDRDMTVEWQCPDCKTRWNRFTGDRIMT